MNIKTGVVRYVRQYPATKAGRRRNGVWNNTWLRNPTPTRFTFATTASAAAAATAVLSSWNTGCALQAAFPREKRPIPERTIYWAKRTPCGLLRAIKVVVVLRREAFVYCKRAERPVRRLIVFHQTCELAGAAR